MKILARTLVEIELAYNQDEENKDDDDKICDVFKEYTERNNEIS